MVSSGSLDTRPITNLVHAQVCTVTLFVMLIGQAIFGVYPLLVIGALQIIVILMVIRHLNWQKLRSANSPAALFAAGLLLLLVTFIHINQTNGIHFILTFLGLFVAPLTFLLADRFCPQDLPVRLAQVAALAGIVILILAFRDVFILQLDRAKGGINPVKFGQLACLIGMLGFSGLLIPGTKRVHAALYLLGTIAAFLAALLSGTRGILLVAIPQLLIMFVFIVSTIPPAKRVKTIAILALMSVLGVTVLTSVFPQRVERMTSIVQTATTAISTGESADASIEIRLKLYASAWTSFLESPLIGVGGTQSLENGKASVDVADYAHAGYTSATHANLPHLHNDPLILAAAGGVLGLVAYLLMLIAPLIGLLGSQRPSKVHAFLAISLVSLAITCGLSTAFLTYDQTLLTYVFLSSLYLTGYRVDLKPIIASDHGSEFPLIGQH